MTRQKLILLASERMNSNKKKDRDEHGLIRMAAAVRKNLKFTDDSVEITPSGVSATSSASRTQVLKIFQAFAADIKEAKKDLKPEELVRVGFVTTKTLNKINGGNGKQSRDIWISDKISNTVMGSDPEFLLFDRNNGSIIRANSVLSNTGKLASDGAMAEIRPDPATSVGGHIANITKLFKSDKAVKNIESYKWAAACYHQDNDRDYPVGGHIHIGNPIRIAKMSENNRKAFFRVLNKVLDELLAIPMVKLDGSDKGRKRRIDCKMTTNREGGYGYFGEFRLCNGRLEHRTLSGMWLLHPSVAKAVLGTAKAIIDEVFRLVSDKKYNTDYMCLFPESSRDHNHMWKDGFDGWKDVPLLQDVRCTTSSRSMRKRLHNSSASSVNTAYLKKWLSTMRSFSTFAKNEKYIRGLYEILKISAAHLQGWDCEIQNNWLKHKKFMVEV